MRQAMVVQVGKFQKYYKKDIIKRFLNKKAIDTLDKMYVDNRHNGHNNIVRSYYLGSRLIEIYDPATMDSFHKNYIKNKIRRTTPRKNVKNKQGINNDTKYRVYFIDPGISRDWFNITLFGITLLRF